MYISGSRHEWSGPARLLKGNKTARSSTEVIYGHLVDVLVVVLEQEKQIHSRFPEDCHAPVSLRFKGNVRRGNHGSLV